LPGENDDDLLELAARQAKLRGVSLSRAVSDLLRRGLHAATPSQTRDGLQMFQLPEDSPMVTTDDARGLKSEGM
jgi:hypothetical protein